jgi:membrane protease YdiL (CAAX protease family)
VVVLLFWPVFDLPTAGAAFALGVTDRPIDVRAEVLADLGALGFAVLLSFVLPAVEEVGLRGYYLDDNPGGIHLQRRTSGCPGA